MQEQHRVPEQQQAQGRKDQRRQLQRTAADIAQFVPGQREPNDVVDGKGRPGQGNGNPRECLIHRILDVEHLDGERGQEHEAKDEQRVSSPLLVGVVPIGGLRLELRVHLGAGALGVHCSTMPTSLRQSWLARRRGTEWGLPAIGKTKWGLAAKSGGQPPL